jgi:tyrosine-protein phosphatase SIW14
MWLQHFRWGKVFFLSMSPLGQHGRAGRTAVALLIVLGGIIPFQGQRKHDSRPMHTPAQKIHVTGVKNFGEVTQFLYRGAQPTPEGFKALSEMGVNIVIDARLSGRDKESKQVNALGMQYVSIPWHCLFPTDEKMARFLAVLRENHGKKVFVHCRYGDDRTGMMIAAYRMSVEHWTPDEARQEMQQFGFNSVACYPLQKYERNFPKRLQENSQLQNAIRAEK